MKLKLLLLVFLAGVAAVVYYWDQVYSRIEGKPPVVAIANPPTGLGRSAVTVELGAQDDSAGLKSVTVSIVQAEEQHQLYTREDLAATKELIGSVELSLTGTKIVEGEATLVVEAVDSSWRENRSRAEYPVMIDFAAPRVAVVSQQHIGQQGGSEFVIIQASDTHLASVGVEVGADRYTAVRLAEIDARFTQDSPLYGALFAIPLDFDINGGLIRAFAEDAAGNRTSAPIRFRINPAKRNNTKPSINRSFLERKLPELLPGYFEMAGVAPEQVADSDEEMLRQFKLVNEQFRGLLNQKLAEILSRTTPKRHWGSSALLKPMPSATSSNFGERRSWVFGSLDAGESEHNGLDLASVRQDIVRSAEAGEVIFDGDLGIYGNTVIIDHGLGLFSLYSHLSSIAVRSGDTVERSTELGRTGETGLAGGDHLHFEFRVGRHPVTPIEWWDGKWIRDHVDSKIEAQLAESAG